MVKICILIIYSKNGYYDKMLELQKKYLNSYENITFFFTQKKIIFNTFQK